MLYVIPVILFLTLIFLTMPPTSCFLEDTIPCPVYRNFTIAVIVTAVSFLGVAIVRNYM